ncbi:MAG TPA: hypothetical protein DGG94_07990 [Micromonosporaceae bacterium]|nr:hypothetical protein [Micromonosporaceae bacterium]HCU49726.1 hypothetical protein [Micromonosporaceae bacterium]
MRTVRAGASDDELLACVRDWVALLAAGDFAGAVEFLVFPEGVYAPGRWTAEDLEVFLANYGSWDPLGDGRIMRVTPIESAVGELAARFEVDRGDGPPAIEFDLPLNGEWSDLTARFELTGTADGRWGFLLYDLHVL